MKGDFTRFTFRPEKHYTNVFMQQGRLQLDADWNEQMNIQAYLSQQQAQDMIGATAGTPASGVFKDGFRISATPDGRDLIIHPGRYYVGGLLCELAEGTPVEVAYQSADRVRVPFLTIDSQPFAAKQWVQIQANLFQIVEVNAGEKTLKLDPPNLQAPESPEQSLFLQRVTTYRTQPDYPEPVEPENGKQYFVYLDVWQRHITAIEDPEIREIALVNIPDTTTRLKTVWQVKLQEINSNDQPNIALAKDAATLENTATWEKLVGDRVVRLNARAKSISENGMADPSVDNQLYRVEIHSPGDLQQARFKWSRNNGTVVSAIQEIKPQENAIVLPKPACDILQSFQAGQWVEISDETRELNHRSGTLVRLKEGVVRIEGKLIFDPATVMGDPIDEKNFPIAHKPKVRRWDWETNQLGLPVSSSNQREWIPLENGIEIEFSLANQATFQTGDYWLIPARMNADQPIEWPQDNAGNPLPQRSLGIHHRFALLALTVPQAEQSSIFPLPSETDFWENADKRTTFPPLIHCFDKFADSFPGSIGIGVKPPLAQLHVKGKSPTDSLIPILRLDASDSQPADPPRLLVTTDGKFGIGTIEPLDTFDLRGTLRISTPENSGYVRLEPQDPDQSIKLTTNATGFEFNKDITVNGFVRVLGIESDASRELKDNIAELSTQEATEILRQLNPVKFSYKADQAQTTHLGFVAEEVPDVVASADKQAISPVDIVAALTKAVKDHRQTIVSLTKLVKEQQQAIERLSEKVKDLERQNS